MAHDTGSSGSARNWIIVAIVAVAALVAIGLGWERQTEGATSASGKPGLVPATSGAPTAGAPEATGRAAISTQVQAVPSASVADPSAFLSPPDRRPLMAHPEGIKPVLPPASRYVRVEETTLFDALSPEDAAWLVAHGYPTWAEVEGLGDMSEPDLAARAAKGDLGAQVLLGIKQNEQRRYRDGYSNIEDAAVRGSTFALAVLAKEQLRAGNLIESAAWQRVAMMRGDWRAGEFLGYYGPSLTAWQMQEADRYAIRYMLNLEQRRRELGLGPFSNTLRPGFDWWRPRLGEQVGIYERPGG
jgi:hypothetical protein